MNSLSSVTDAELLESTRALMRRSNQVEADLLVHLAEVEERRVHLERAFSSMHEFCTEELGMSEGVAYNRIYVARLSRRLPQVLEWIRSGRIHLSGLRVLAPHLTETNCADVLSEAAGKSKRKIEELATRFAPKPLVPTTLRKLPTRSVTAPTIEVSAPEQAAPPPPDTLVLENPPAHATPRKEVVQPLAPDAFKLTLTIDGHLRDKLKQAEELMRHRVDAGDVGAILSEALDLLIDEVKKERFGVGRKPRATPEAKAATTEAMPTASRHIPDAIKRAVYERDGGRCSFVSADGRRCTATGGLEFDHLDGFAITRVHSVERIALRCHAHNFHAAEKLFGREKMARMKNSSSATCPGASEQKLLL